MIGYAQMEVCWTTNNTRTISRLNRNTNKGDKGTQVTKTQIVTNNSKYRTREVNIAYESTQSVLNVLKAARVTTEEYGYHQSCAQYKYQHRQGRNTLHRTHNTVREFVLPVYNRFNKLGRGNQGN